MAKGENGALGEIRTPDLMVRSHALYPTELRAHTLGFNQTSPFKSGPSVYQHLPIVNQAPLA